MNPRIFSTVSLLLALGAPLHAQERPPETPLERANRTFAAIDLNRDGALDASEIAEASVPRSVLRTWDEDGNRSLSKDEFLLYYRQLMINAGQRPGEELDREARRIEALIKSRKEQEARRKERQRELEQRESAGEGESAQQKYRRAQAALEARRKQEAEEEGGDAAGGEARAGEAGVDSGRATRERLDRAREALERSGQADEEERAAAALALVRALDALESRAKSGNWSREQYDRERLDLILRARGVQPAGKTDEERAAAAEALVRALDAMEARARSGDWSREMYEKQRQVLILRARGTEGGAAGAAGRPRRPDEPTQRAQALTRALDALDARARSGGWSRDQYERERLDLILRARALPEGAEGDERTRAARALVRALDALDNRARSGGWSRDQYERERLDLILRARSGKTPGDVASPERPVRPPSAGSETADPDAAATALARALDAMEARARSGNWSREMYEKQRQDLIARARGVDLGVPASDGAARSRAALALVRALDALDNRARSGGWSRDQYERERLDLILRARSGKTPGDAASPERPVRPPSAGSETADPDAAAKALARALDAMEARARSGNWSREMYEKQRQDLIVRARGVDLGVPASDGAARSRAALALVRALDALENRSRTGKWSRDQYERERLDLILRARSGKTPGDAASPERPVRPPSAGSETADPDAAAKALARALDAMEARARSGNWSREMYEKQRQDLIVRARGVDLGVPASDGAARSRAALALVRALDALENRSRSGKWSRDQYERERLELILRARSTKDPGNTGGADRRGGQPPERPAKTPPERPAGAGGDARGGARDSGSGGGRETPAREGEKEKGREKARERGGR